MSEPLQVRPIRPTFPEEAYVLPVGQLQLEGGYVASFYSGTAPTVHVLDLLAALAVAELVEVRLGWDVVGVAGGASGVGDLRLGVKGGFFGGLREQTALAGIFEMQLPVGTAPAPVSLDEGVRFLGGLVASQMVGPVQFDLQVALDTHLFVSDPTFLLPIALGIRWAPIDELRVYGDGVVSLDMSDLSDTQTSILGGAGYRVIPQLEISAAARVGLSPSLPDVVLQAGVAWLVGDLW